jgi:hypothetical protein
VRLLEDRTVPSTLTVTSPLDNGAPGTLRAVLASAAAGDTIDFAKKLDGKTITLTQGQLTLTQNVDIEGPGAGELAISGNHAGRVFDVQATGVTIAGLTIAGGSVTGLGSAGNPADIGGGGILNEATGGLTLSDCVVSGNTATAQSSSVDVWGGGLPNEGTAMVVSCTFGDDVATGGNSSSGGGVGNFAGATLTITDCTFNDNQTLAAAGSGIASFGGAIVNFSFDPLHPSSANISGSAFANNLAGAANAEGGAVVDEGTAATMVVTDSTFSQNQAIGDGSGATANGGAVFAVFDNLTLTGCGFTNNQAVGGAGGDGVNTFSQGAGGAIAAYYGNAVRPGACDNQPQPSSRWSRVA